MCVFKTIRVFSLSCKKRAVLTIETAIILPVFLCAMLLLTSISSIYYVRMKIEATINEEIKHIAMEKHFGNSVSVSIFETRVCDRLGEKLVSSGIIRDGRNGLDFEESDLTGTEIVTVCVKYNVKLPFDITGLCNIPFRSEKIIHTWTGYDKGLAGLDDYSDYVYMTENGTVYHTTRECSHIRLHINSVNGNDIRKLRNENGAKYKRCIYCKPKLSDGKLYITTDGDRYHNTLSCSGLKRTVIRVRKSKLKGIQPCSRCGY